MKEHTKNAKAGAKRLRAFMADKDIALSHSDSLEAIAHIEGYRDWNTLSAHLPPTGACAVPTGTLCNSFPVQVGSKVSGLYYEAPFEGTLLGLEQTINPAVWRVKLQFDEPVTPPAMTRIGLTRRRVQGSINKDGISVNLLGKPDGHIRVYLNTQ
ncbi:glyoxalase superfamily protein [Kordiimonas pumila]|uniref:Glyoxalase superfamily protein n=1 Tax=Kordiimonas pumila TaxID=2161677 RepID=A0ABV7D0S3_9PROT|nr:glyoxalase superfamily protein [Kordiimonas pumila]